MYPQYVEPLCDDVIQIRTMVEKALVRVKKSYKDSESGAENDRLYDMEIEYDLHFNQSFLSHNRFIINVREKGWKS